MIAFVQLTVFLLIFGSKCIVDGGKVIEGIDVSHHNGDIDWQNVIKSGIKFTFIKATEGKTYVDPKLITNFWNASSLGLYVGFYHFGRPTNVAGDGAKQAQFFYNTTHRLISKNRTLLGTLDTEYNPKGDTCYDLTKQEMRTWLQDFFLKYSSLIKSNNSCILYTTTQYWNSCVGNDWKVSFCNNVGDHPNCPLWIARWNVRNPYPIPSMWPYWTFWQYSSTGSVPGIKGQVDRNLFNGTESSLQMYTQA